MSGLANRPWEQELSRGGFQGKSTFRFCGYILVAEGLWDPRRPGCPTMGRDREGTVEVAEKQEVCMAMCSEWG